jgi:hypothetical protein
MPIRQNRPFKAPRQAKSKVVTKDSDEDDIPIAQTLETTTQSHVHRKDLGEIEKRKEAADQSQTTADNVMDMEIRLSPQLDKIQR